MKTVFWTLVAVCFAASTGCAHSGGHSTTPTSASHSEGGLVAWDTAAGQQRLREAEFATDFFPLSNHFTSQDNGFVCGLASSAIVLNTIRLRKKEGLPTDETSIPPSDRAYLPPPERYSPFLGKYTQNNVLTEKTKQKLEVLGKPTVINGEETRDFGLQLRQLAQVLESHGLEVETRVVGDEVNTQQVRSELIENLKNADDYILINYKRKVLGQPGGGHISPVGAYHAPSDSFLVMDVNPNKAPWVWVPAADLIAAMRTFDTVENRGYVMVAEGKGVE